jgi:hypothetical protein
MSVTGSVSCVANLGAARCALNPAGYNCFAIQNYMIGRFSLDRCSRNAGLYPARGIRPCSVLPATSRSRPLWPARAARRALIRHGLQRRPGPTLFGSPRKHSVHSRSLVGSGLCRLRGPGSTGRSEVLSGIRERPLMPFLCAPGSAGHVAPCLTPRCSQTRLHDPSPSPWLTLQHTLSHLPSSARAAERER